MAAVPSSAEDIRPKAHTAFSRRILPGIAGMLAVTLLAAAVAVIQLRNDDLF